MMAIYWIGDPQTFSSRTNADMFEVSRNAIDSIQRSIVNPSGLRSAVQHLVAVNTELLRRIDRMQTIVYELAGELDQLEVRQ